MRQAIYVVIGVLAGFLIAGVTFAVATVPAGRPVTLIAAPTTAPLEVDVEGAVLRPGVYILVEGSRVQDAISAAGGLSAEAALDSTNLAARLEDGQQLDIPYLGGAALSAVPTTAFRILPAGTTATPSGDLVTSTRPRPTSLKPYRELGQQSPKTSLAIDLRTGPFCAH